MRVLVPIYFSEEVDADNQNDSSIYLLTDSAVESLPKDFLDKASDLVESEVINLAEVAPQEVQDLVYNIEISGIVRYEDIYYLLVDTSDLYESLNEYEVDLILDFVELQMISKWGREVEYRFIWSKDDDSEDELGVSDLRLFHLHFWTSKSYNNKVPYVIMDESEVKYIGDRYN